jgi:hypothetical protein
VTAKARASASGGPEDVNARASRPSTLCTPGHTPLAAYPGPPPATRTIKFTSSVTGAPHRARMRATLKKWRWHAMNSGVLGDGWVSGTVDSQRAQTYLPASSLSCGRNRKNCRSLTAIKLVRSPAAGAVSENGETQEGCRTHQASSPIHARRQSTPPRQTAPFASGLTYQPASRLLASLLGRCEDVQRRAQTLD